MHYSGKTNPIVPALFTLLLLISFPLAAKSIKVGVYNATAIGVSATDLKIGLEVWVREMTKSQGFESTVYYYDDISKMAEDFKNGVIDGAIATPLSFVKHFDSSLLLPGISGYKSDKRLASTLYVLVRKEDRSKPLRDILEKRISIPKVAEGSRIYIETLSLENGIGKKPHFLDTPNGQRAIFNLFFKKSDMAVVSASEFNTACELNPQLKERLAIVKKRNLFVENLLFFRKGMDREFYEYVLKNAIDLPKSKRGREVMILFKADILDYCYPDELNETRRLYDTYLHLKERKEHHVEKH